MVEAYEIRPGILMMPSYSETGQVCQITLEKRHVSSKNIDLDAEMPEEEISRMVDQLAPKGERGRPRLNLGDNGNISMIDGHTLATIAMYENVSVRMYGKSKGAGPKSYVAATINWEKRKCRDAILPSETGPSTTSRRQTFAESADEATKQGFQVQGCKPPQIRS